MVNPKTIDSVSTKVISKKQDNEIINLDSETDSEKVPAKAANVGLTCRKRKKETVMEAVDRRVRSLIKLYHFQWGLNVFHILVHQTLLVFSGKRFGRCCF